MKNSTKRVSQLTIGLDLGDLESSYCVLGGERQVMEEGRVATTAEAFRERFQRFAGATMVFEVGSQSRWVQPLLLEMGMSEAIAADPRQIKLINQSVRKTDRKDAYILARAGQGLPELLHPVRHRSQQAHSDLSVVRSRELLVQQRTQLVNRMRGMIKASGSRIVGCDAAYFFRKAPSQIPEHLRDACDPLLQILTHIHEQLLAIRRKLKQIVAERYPIVETLQTVTGVGPCTALTFVLTIEDPQRFRRNRHVAPYLGLTPKKRDSGTCSPQLGITKAGDGHLRRLLVLCAHYVLLRGKDSHLRRWGLSLAERGGRGAKKRAIVAVARKLAILLLALWRSGRSYDPDYLTPRPHKLQVA